MYSGSRLIGIVRILTQMSLWDLGTSGEVGGFYEGVNQTLLEPMNEHHLLVW